MYNQFYLPVVPIANPFVCRLRGKTNMGLILTMGSMETIGFRIEKNVN